MEYYVLSYAFHLFISEFSFSNEKLSISFISVSGCSLEKSISIVQCSDLFTSGSSSSLVASSFMHSGQCLWIDSWGADELRLCARSGPDLDAQKIVFSWSWSNCHLKNKNVVMQNQTTSRSASVFYSDSDQNQQGVRREQLQMMLHPSTLLSSNHLLLRDVLEPDAPSAYLANIS